MSEQIEQLIAEFRELPRQAAGELGERGLQLRCVAGFDDTQDGFRLREIETTREKSSQRKFTGPGEAGAVLAQGSNRQVEEGRRSGKIEFRERLARVTACGRPEVECRGDADFDL